MPIKLTPLGPQPLVSILIASYNYERFLSEALDSVLAQTYERFEAIVCDDGSKDRSAEIAGEYARSDDRIKLIEKDNGGAASALNRAHEAARGEILCLLDADDRFHPRKLETIVSAFQKEAGCGLMVHALMVVDEKGAPIQRKPSFGFFETGWLRDRVISNGGRWNYVEASGVSLRSEVAHRVFPVPEQEMRTWADAFVCVAAACIGPVGFVDEALAYYRIHGSNVSGSADMSLDRARQSIDGYHRLTGALNEWGRRIGDPTLRIEVDRNLAYVESQLSFKLLSPRGSTTGAPRTYLRYARLIITDSGYSLPRKLLSLFFMGTALLIPRKFRAGWLTTGLSPSAGKERLRHWAGAARRIVRSNKARGSARG